MNVVVRGGTVISDGQANVANDELEQKLTVEGKLVYSKLKWPTCSISCIPETEKYLIKKTDPSLHYLRDHVYVQ